MQSSKLFPYLCASVAMIFWSLSFIWYKEVLVLYKPITLILLRLVISCILLLLVSASMGWLQRVQRGDVKHFLLLAFFEPFLYFVGESHGISLIPSTLAAVIISTIPVFTPLAAYYLLRERITPMNLTGIVVSMAGVCLVVFHRGVPSSAEANPWGIALMFLAVFSAIAYSILIRKLTLKYNVFSIVTYQNTIGMVFFIPWFLTTDLSHFAGARPTWEVMRPLLYLGVFASTAAFIAFVFAIKRLGLNRAIVFTNSIPVLTAIFAYFILAEALTPVKMVGIGVVVLGLFMSQLHGSRLRFPAAR